VARQAGPVEELGHRPPVVVPRPPVERRGQDRDRGPAVRGEAALAVHGLEEPLDAGDHYFNLGLARLRALSLRFSSRTLSLRTLRFSTAREPSCSRFPRMA